MSAEEINHRTMMLEAILSIQAGDNPRVLAEKLESFVAAGASAAARARRATAVPTAPSRGRPRERRRRSRRSAATGTAAGHDGGDERWLLTYADMITLLMALFMVLWSISSVNICKFQELQHVAAGGVRRRR